MITFNFILFRKEKRGIDSGIYWLFLLFSRYICSLRPGHLFHIIFHKFMIIHNINALAIDFSRSPPTVHWRPCSLFNQFQLVILEFLTYKYHCFNDKYKLFLFIVVNLFAFSPVFLAPIIVRNWLLTWYQSDYIDHHFWRLTVHRLNQFQKKKLVLAHP